MTTCKQLALSVMIPQKCSSALSFFPVVTFKSKPGKNKDDHFNAPKAQIKNADDVTRV